MSFRRRLLTGLTVLLVLLVSGSLCAQVSTARLEGVVTDETGAIIPGVTVMATHDATNISYSSVSSDSGRYVFALLPPGTYTVVAELPSFKRYVGKGVELRIGDAITLNIKLQVGEVAEEVVVTTETPTVDTISPKIGAVVERQQILALPLNGRNPMMLYYLQAGTNPIDTVGSQQARGSVDGLRTNANNTKIEGVWASDASYDNSPAAPFVPTPLEAVGEYRVTTSSTSLENGRGAGAQVSLVYKSGGNDFHGSVYEFNRNTTLNANDWFSNRQGTERPVFQRHQFGYSIGGPIQKDRTFFFHTTEWQREKQAGVTNRLVYTDTLRQGIFRYYTKGANSGSLVDASGNPTVASADIGTIDLLTIDPTRLGMDPTGRVTEALGIIPLPNNYDIGDGLNTAGFRFNSPALPKNYQYLIKVDHKLSDIHQLKGTWSYSESVNPDAPAYPGYFTRFPNTQFNRAAMFGWTSTFSPTLINEFTAGGYAWSSHTRNGNPDSQDTSGIFNLRGLGHDRGGAPNGNLVGIYQAQRNPIVGLSWSDNMTWIKNNHTYKWGFEFTRGSKFNWFGGDYYIPVIDTLNSGNPATIPSLPGLNSNDRSRAQQLTNDLTGSVGFIRQDFHANHPIDRGYAPFDTRYRRLVQPEYGLYLQDTWKLRSNVTFNYGVRWDFLIPSYAIDGVYTYPSEGPASVLGMTASPWLPDITPAGRFESSLAPDQGRGIQNYDWNNFSPSIGFIWDPTGAGKTSISVNFRVAHDRHMISTYSRFEDQNQGLSIINEVAPASGIRFGDVSRDVLPIAPPGMIFPLLPDTREGRAYALNPTTRTPYTQSWSLRLQREFFKEWTAEAAYVGNIGVGGWRAINVNQINVRENGFLEGFLAAQRNLVANGNPNMGESIGILAVLFGPMGGIPSSQNTAISRGEVADVANFADTTTFQGLRGGLVTAAGLPVNFFRGNPQVLNANVADNLSVSTFHGLKLGMNRRFSNGLYLQLNYTFGKGLSDYEGGQGQYNDFRDNDNRRLDKTFLRFDSTHILNGNGILALPFGRSKRWGSDWNGWVDAVLGGWQLNGILQVATSRPFTITTNRNTLTVNDTATTNFSGTDFNITSNVVKGPTQVRAISPEQTSLFSNPGAGDPGGTPEWSFRSSMYTNVDLSIFKNFRLPMLGEEGSLQFRAEFFNLLNHANFDTPTADINSGSFGVIGSTFGTPRIGQLALKLIF